MYDTAIIGTGPAGLSAAINLTQLGKTIIWFGPKEMSGKVAKSELIANYPGLGKITGKDLGMKFKEHAGELGLVITDALVTTVSAKKDGFMLLAENEIYEARTVLFATGSVTGKGLPGEEEFLGRGVSYCATCDGFLYKNKTLAAVSFDKRFEHELEFLAGIAKNIYIQRLYKEEKDLPKNAEALSSPVVSIKGGMRVESIELADGRSLSVDGVFIMKNAIAPTSILKGLATEGPDIVADRSMATNIPGCFACGDCTGRPYQIAKAVGEGNIAAHSIAAYLG